MTANAFVRARIDEKLRNEAASVLAEMGLTVSDVVRMTLTRIAREKALPFELKVPTAETQAAMEESRAMMKARRKRTGGAQELVDELDREAGRRQAR